MKTRVSHETFPSYLHDEKFLDRFEASNFENRAFEVFLSLLKSKNGSKQWRN